MSYAVAALKEMLVVSGNRLNNQNFALVEHFIHLFYFCPCIIIHFVLYCENTLRTIRNQNVPDLAERHKDTYKLCGSPPF